MYFTKRLLISVFTMLYSMLGKHCRLMSFSLEIRVKNHKNPLLAKVYLIEENILKRGMGELLDLIAIEEVLLYFKKFYKAYKFIFLSLG